MERLKNASSLTRRVVAVLAGGFCGTITRYGLSLLIQGWLGKDWPYDILLINLSGAFVLAFVTILADETFLVGPTRRLFINVGFLGAYTTFSSLALGDMLLLGKGQWLAALAYLALSLGGGVLAVWLGDWLALVWMQRVRRKRVLMKRPGLGHLDIQDDVLLPDQFQDPSSRRLP